MGRHLEDAEVEDSACELNDSDSRSSYRAGKNEKLVHDGMFNSQLQNNNAGRGSMIGGFASRAGK